MGFIYSLLGFLAAITVLVAIHEYGHFKIARLCGIKVKRFSIGFGKPIWSRVDKHGTEWAIAPFPLGGYISMVDTRIEEPAPGDEAKAFDKKSVGARSAVVAAGPLANLALAFAIWTALLMGSAQEFAPKLGAAIPGSVAASSGLLSADLIVEADGSPIASLSDLQIAAARAAIKGEDLRVKAARGSQAIETSIELSKLGSADLASGDVLRAAGFSNPASAAMPAKIKSILPGGAAQLADLRPGDRVLAIDGKPIETWSEMSAIVNPSAGKKLSFSVVGADGKERSALVSPKADPKDPKQLGKIGASVDAEGLAPEIKAKAFVTIERGFAAAAAEAASRCVKFTKMTIDAIGSIFAGKASSDTVSGPIGIAQQAGSAAEAGAETYANFIAFLSLSLFIMNLLPLPGLDGGHLALFAIEKAKGSPLSEKAQNTAARIGFSMLGALMVFALFNDIGKFFK